MTISRRRSDLWHLLSSFEIADFGPDLPFAAWLSAALQLHQTGHSSILQHFWLVKVGRAGQRVS